MATQSLPKVIYVAGYGRSGSTLIDCLLGQYSGVFGGGELTNFFDDRWNGRACSCGSRLSKCECWVQVAPPLADSSSDLEFAMVTRKAERLVLPRFDERYQEVWKPIFSNLGSRHHVEFVVDSSKTSRISCNRPLRLQQVGCEVLLIHLVRRPEGVISSLSKGSNKTIEAGTQSASDGFWPRGVVGWFVANFLVERLVKRYGMRRYFVRYEDLVRDPETKLRHIGEFVDSCAIRNSDMSSSADHGVSGNRMRRQNGEIVVNASKSPKIPLSGIQRLAASVMTRWGSRHGYWAK